MPLTCEKADILTHKGHIKHHRLQLINVTLNLEVFFPFFSNERKNDFNYLDILKRCESNDKALVLV